MSTRTQELLYPTPARRDAHGSPDLLDEAVGETTSERRIEAALRLLRDDAGRLDFITQRILTRSLRANELPVVLDSLKTIREHYAANGEDAKKLITVGESKPDAALNAAELATWTMIVNELLNLDEVLNK